MAHRKNNTQEKTLRRSPRFLQIVAADPEDPKTPNPDHHRRTRSFFSAATPHSCNVSSRRRSLRSNSKHCLQKLDESCNARQIVVSSRRLDPCVEECDAEKLPCSSDPRNRKLEKRVTRSASHRDLDKNVQKIDYSGYAGDKIHDCSSADWIHEEGADILMQIKGKSQNNKGKHSNKSCDNSSNQLNTLAYDGENQVLDEELSKVDKHNIQDAVVVNQKQKNCGVKRTRTQFEITQGWTKDQEFALERAYLEAKPTPHFWKKVSRLVPGKSAQECFDKVHGSHMTPPQPHTRSRARVSSSQNPSLSASKLIETSSPTTKRPKSRKQKSHVIQRTVRNMLQNQYKKEQDSQSDLFSILEPTFSPLLNLNVVLTTPDCSQESDSAHKRSATSHKKSASRFSGSNGATTLVSPPVLKQVKNKALHEKYIDLLNRREANRKAASAKEKKVDISMVMKLDSSVERKGAVKAAKNTLLFDANDAISEFQHQQATALEKLFDYESGADADEDADVDEDKAF